MCVLFNSYVFNYNNSSSFNSVLSKTNLKEHNYLVVLKGLGKIFPHLKNSPPNTNPVIYEGVKKYQPKWDLSPD